jgi:endonuclease YncB( thermonuclease family)|tara:strand:+ start:636 stop:1151 length:516 start_codon:yes stop_codon:yes gene_type:complete
MKLFNATLIILLILSLRISAGELKVFSGEKKIFLQNKINGIPSVTDGDTIKILNKRIRFYGIDAPEIKQVCIKNSKEYNCGKVASRALKKKINGKPVTCKVQDELDRYKRYIGVCYLKDIDLNKWMVRNGHAVSYKRYSRDYIKDENYAKKNKIGLWSGNFINPEKWRKLN